MEGEGEDIKRKERVQTYKVLREREDTRITEFCQVHRMTSAHVRRCCHVSYGVFSEGKWLMSYSSNVGD